MEEDEARTWGGQKKGNELWGFSGINDASQDQMYPSSLQQQRDIDPILILPPESQQVRPWGEVSQVDFYSKSGFVVLDLRLSLCAPDRPARLSINFEVVNPRLAPKGKIDSHTEIPFLKLDGRTRRSILWPADYSPRRKVYGDRFQSSFSRGDLDQEPGQNACGQNDACRDAAESQCSPPSMALAKLAEFACTGRARTQVVKPGLRLLKG
jgi:hypothetical protein